MSAQVSWQRRLFPSRPLSVMVFLFWLLLSDSFGPQQWVLGLLLGWVVPIFAARLDREFARIGSLRSVPRMLLVAAVDIVRSNIKVALQVLGRNRVSTPALSGCRWTSRISTASPRSPA